MKICTHLQQNSVNPQAASASNCMQAEGNQQPCEYMYYSHLHFQFYSLVRRILCTQMLPYVKKGLSIETTRKESEFTPTQKCDT